MTVGGCSGRPQHSKRTNLDRPKGERVSCECSRGARETVWCRPIPAFIRRQFERAQAMNPIGAVLIDGQTASKQRSQLSARTVCIAERNGPERLSPMQRAGSEGVSHSEHCAASVQHLLLPCNTAKRIAHTAVNTRANVTNGKTSCLSVDESGRNSVQSGDDASAHHQAAARETQGLATLIYRKRGDAQPRANVGAGTYLCTQRKGERHGR
jgi:hypothetical protein